MKKDEIMPLLELATDLLIASSGEGEPYIRVEFSNYGKHLEVRVIDNGFSIANGYDGDYAFYIDRQCSERMYKRCVNHIMELLGKIEEKKNE